MADRHQHEYAVLGNAPEAASPQTPINVSLGAEVGPSLSLPPFQTTSNAMLVPVNTILH